MADNFYLTKLGTWTFDIRDENNWWPDLDSAKAFLKTLKKKRSTKRVAVSKQRPAPSGFIEYVSMGIRRPCNSEQCNNCWGSCHRTE